MMGGDARGGDVPAGTRPAERTVGAAVQIKKARILVVDDDLHVLRLVERTLSRGGYENVLVTTDSREALGWMAEQLPDIVVLDINMPGLDGYGVLAHLQRVVPESAFLPVLAITGAVSRATTRKALDMGANDVVRKPFDPSELLLRVRNLLQMRLLYLELELERRSLEQRVRARTRELRRSHLDGLRRLARAAEFRDDETGRHTQRVGDIAARIATEIGLGSAEVERLRVAASLHDVGKIGVPDEILLKKGPLTDLERARMQRHTVIGADLFSDGSSEVMRLAAVVARTHHEWFDGSGYPEGLRGNEIPLVGRIVAVADYYDAVTTKRPYRDAWTAEAAVEKIRTLSGTHFDPCVVEAFLRCFGHRPTSTGEPGEI
jgi:putative two-component system response regulator